MKSNVAFALILCVAVVALFPRVEAKEDQVLKPTSRKLQEVEAERNEAVATRDGTELEYDPTNNMRRTLTKTYGKYPKTYVRKKTYKLYNYYYYEHGKKYYYTKPVYYYHGKKYRSIGFYYRHGVKYYYYTKH